jgi:hypothetical protein
MRLIVSLLAVVTLAGVACHDEGPQRRQQIIYGIKVTPSAAAVDTIRISFNTGGNPCNTDMKVETEFPPGGLRFSVSDVPVSAVCPLDAIQVPIIYVVAPPHSTPFTVRFAEPGQQDSVRVVGTP